MPQVKARPGESIDELLRRFKKVVEQSGILSDYRKKERYEKPSVKRKRKQAAAIKRSQKKKKQEARERERFRKSKDPSWRWNRNHTKKIFFKPTSSTNSFKRKPTNRR